VKELLLVEVHRIVGGKPTQIIDRMYDNSSRARGWHRLFIVNECFLDRQRHAVLLLL
jgi:hypothetical protein